VTSDNANRIKHECSTPQSLLKVLNPSLRLFSIPAAISYQPPPPPPPTDPLNDALSFLDEEEEEAPAVMANVQGGEEKWFGLVADDQHFDFANETEWM
jgi:hypothetical protein